MGDTVSGHGYLAPSNFTYETLGGLLDEVAEAAFYADLSHADFFGDGFGDLVANGPERWRAAVHQVFADFLGMPEPSGFDWELAEIAYSAEQVNVTPGAVGPGGGPGPTGSTSAEGLPAALTNLEDRSAQLSGHTAKAFHDNYVAPLRPLVGNLHVATVGLSVALAGEQALWTRARQDVLTIAGKSFEAMLASEKESSGDGGLGIALTVLGALASAAAVVASGGGAAIVITGLAGIGAGTAGGLLSSGSAPEQPHVELGADKPQGVLENIRTALDRLRTSIATEEGHIETFTTDLVSAVGQDDKFDIRSPLLLRDDCASHVLADDQIFLTRADIAHITDVWLPEVAGTLDASSRTRDTPSAGHWERSGNLGVGPNGAYPTYLLLDDMVRARAGNTSAELRASAEHLRIAASAIGAADTTANRRLAAHTKKLGLVPLA